MTRSKARQISEQEEEEQEEQEEEQELQRRMTLMATIAVATVDVLNWRLNQSEGKEAFGRKEKKRASLLPSLQLLFCLLFLFFCFFVFLFAAGSG